MASTARTVVIGAGPAGLGCALALSRAGRPTVVMEKDDEVGGLCRTLNYEGFLFDIGGHRFLSKSSEVNRLWLELLDGDLLRIRRLSRIFYQGKFFKYPLVFADTLTNLGPWESVRCAGSFLWAIVLRPGEEKTFEGWVVNRFGRRLFETFFDSYTQKVWGLPCSRLSSDWAAQRIQGMSFGAAVREAIFRAGKRRPKTFYDEFLYPRRGPGQLFTKLKERCQQAGATFLLKTRVTGLRHDGRDIVSVEVSRGPGGETSAVPVDQVLSSMPLTDLVRAFSPPPPREVLSAAAGLRFRDFLSVNLIVNGSLLFPDQWIYVHSPKVKLSRIQNFKNWSSDMVGSADKTSLGLEYFCSEGDELWRADDTDLIRLAAEDLEAIGLASSKNIEGGFVVRRDKAYPVYDLGYGWPVSLLRDYLGRFSNFQTLGRAGLFRYDNSDLALLTGIQAAENLTSEGKTDLWAYNVSA